MKMSEEYEAWIRQSIDDLKAAQRLLGEFNDKAANFAQQAAEKIIKAFFLFNNENIRYIHPTETLMECLLQKALITDEEFNTNLESLQTIDEVHRSISQDEEIVCRMCEIEYPKGNVAPCEDIDYEYAKKKIDCASELIGWFLKKMNYN